MCGLRETVIFADHLMYTGFGFAAKGGISIAVDDMEIPKEKAALLAEANAEVKEIEDQYRQGLVNQRSNVTTSGSIFGVVPAIRSLKR